MKLRFLPLIVLGALCPLLAQLRAASSEDVKLTRLDDRVRVEVGGQLFTEYIFKGAPRPYLYPVLATDGTSLTREFPMRKDVVGETNDHPHHRAIFFGHGSVNGINFWAEGKGMGLSVHDKLVETKSGKVGVIRANNRWTSEDGKLVATDETKISIRAVPGGRELDFEITVHAPKNAPVIFGDTKEGTLAIRLADWMRPPRTAVPKKGAPAQKMAGTGHIVNDSGNENAETWGKRAKWVDYYASHKGKVYGVAMFDHPKNPQYPTWWHVRDYGLFAVNPFGKHDFEPAFKDDPKAGDMVVPAGKSVTFRYRFYFHNGDEKAAGVAKRAAAFAAGK